MMKPRSFRLTRAWAVGTAVAVWTVGLVGCTADRPVDADRPVEPERTSLSIAVPQSQFYANFEPNDAFGLFFTPSQAVYDSLIQQDLETKVYGPSLAEEFKISDDGLTLSMTLREDVVFTDGAKLDAQVVVDDIKHYFSAKDGYFGSVTGAIKPQAEVTGEYTLQITTDVPTYDDGLLMFLLSKFPIVSPEAYLDSDRLQTEPAGTGPYILDEYVPDVSVSFVRNPDYWDPEAYPYDELKITVFEDKVSALNALKSGELDAAELEFGQLEEAKASGLNVEGGVSGYVGFAVIDREGAKFPAFGDVRVRQAIAHAFDRDAIKEKLLLGYGTTSTQPFAPTSREYVDGGDDRYAYDPQRSRDLLAEAGYPDGLTIQLPNVDAVYAAVDYRPVVEQYLSDIGITIKWVDVSDDRSWVDAVDLPAEFANQFYGNSIEIFVNKAGTGAQPVSDPKFNDMLATYSTGTPAEREEIQPILADYILEQAWWIPIVHPEVVWATQSDIVATPDTLPDVRMFGPTE